LWMGRYITLSGSNIFAFVMRFISNFYGDYLFNFCYHFKVSFVPNCPI
jgi:hypothetical protein